MEFLRKKKAAASPPRPASVSTEAGPAARGGSAAMRNVNLYHQELTPDDIAKGEHRRMVGGRWDEIGPLQLEYLKGQGLLPGDKFCDTGCGALRGGIHFVRYLEEGNYHGLDINASLLEAGRAELRKAGLEGKQPTLLVDDQFRMSRFGVKFDCMLAVSVFTHLFANHIVRCLVEARAALGTRGRFYATFFLAPSSARLAPLEHQPGGIVTQYDRDPFHYSAEEIESMGRLAGMKAEILGEWNHPLDQQMVLFSAA